jgi:FlaA1/EpsC-like NDP-sugar epimerase
MEILLILLFIRLIVRDTNESIKIYEVIFKKENNKQPEYGNVSITKPQPKPVTKKEELLESLEFLKNKKVKTKQDKESIDIINSVLKNMS